jgi:thiamine transporter ThiT
MNVTKNREDIKNLTAAAICLALCILLPYLTAQIPQLGQALAPMHIPVLLCAFICGPRYAAIVGLVAPLLRFMIAGMPLIMPMGVAMCFELAAYGIAAGILYKLLPKKTVYIYVSLISAMLFGRVVFGLAFMQTFGMHTGGQYTWEMYVSAAFVTALPGIILHIVLIPVIVIALKRAKLLTN